MANREFITSEELRKLLHYDPETSGYKGVSIARRGKPWRVQINIDRKVVCLGQFSTLEEAIRVRRDAEMKYHGEFSRQS
jgi:ribosomal protein S3